MPALLCHWSGLRAVHLNISTILVLDFKWHMILIKYMVVSRYYAVQRIDLKQVTVPYAYIKRKWYKLIKPVDAML